VQAQFVDAFSHLFGQGFFIVVGGQIDGDQIAKAPPAQGALEPEPAGPIDEKSVDEQYWRLAFILWLSPGIKQPKGQQQQGEKIEKNFLNNQGKGQPQRLRLETVFHELRVAVSILVPAQAVGQNCDQGQNGDKDRYQRKEEEHLSCEPFAAEITKGEYATLVLTRQLRIDREAVD